MIIRNIIIFILATLMVLLSFWVNYQSLINGPLWWVLIGITAFIGGAGLLFRKPWSRYPVFMVVGIEAGFWLYEVVRVAMEGWPYSDGLITVLSLLPGVLLLLFCFLGCFVVQGYFREQRNTLRLNKS